MSLSEPKVKDIAVVTQLYYQVYITYQLHDSANAAVAIIRMDTILSEKLYRYDITQNNY